MIPTSFGVLIAAACVLADPSGDSAPGRRAFDVSISFGKPLHDSDDDLQQGQGQTFQQGPQQNLQQGQQRRSPVTGFDLGNGQTWQPHPPALLEPKGPPPFMPDDAGSIEVPAVPMARQTTTTTRKASGIFEAAMPLVSGVENMVGQAEQGAKKLLHLPAGEKKAASGAPTSPSPAEAMEAKTAQANLRLRTARQQEMQLQAQLAKVKAELKKTDQGVPESQSAKAAQSAPQPVTALPTQPPPPEPMEAKAKATQRASEAVTSKPMQGPPEPAKAKAMESQALHACAEAEGAACKCRGTVYYGKKFVSGVKGATTTLQELKASAFVQKTVNGAVSCDYKTMGKDPLPGVMKWCYCDAKASSESAKATSQNGSTDKQSGELNAMDKALKGSGSDEVNTDYNRKFMAMPSISRSQDDALTKGIAVVALAALMVFVAYLVKARVHTPAAVEVARHSEESGLE